MEGSEPKFYSGKTNGICSLLTLIMPNTSIPSANCTSESFRLVPSTSLCRRSGSTKVGNGPSCKILNATTMNSINNMFMGIWYTVFSLC